MHFFPLAVVGCKGCVAVLVSAWGFLAERVIATVVFALALIGAFLVERGCRGGSVSSSGEFHATGEGISVFWGILFGIVVTAAVRA